MWLRRPPAGAARCHGVWRRASCVVARAESSVSAPLAPFSLPFALSSALPRSFRFRAPLLLVALLLAGRRVAVPVGFGLCMSAGCALCRIHFILAQPNNQSNSRLPSRTAGIILLLSKTKDIMANSGQPTPPATHI